MSFSSNLKKIARLPNWLNWLLSVVEPCIILAITFLIGYSAYWLVFGHDGSSQQARLTQLMKLMNDDWKAALILLVLLFYRTIRIFLEQAEEAWGVKRKRPIIGEPEENPNPPEERL